MCEPLQTFPLDLLARHRKLFLPLVSGEGPGRRKAPVTYVSY